MTAKITIKDVRQDGGCKDVRRWLVKHGFDARRFLRSGITAAELKTAGQSVSRIDRLETIAEAREILEAENGR